MKLLQGLARRLLAVSVIYGACGALMTGVLGTFAELDVVSRYSARIVRELLRAPSNGCLASPGGWSHTSADGILLEGFDAAELGAPDHAGPGLVPSLAARLRAGEDEPVEVYYPSFRGGDRWGGAVLVRAADTGPCSLIQARWPLMPERRRILWMCMLAAAISAALAGAVSSGLVVMPLLRRIGRLHAATHVVGEGAGYRPTAGGPPDELGDLARALDTAHERIVEDAARLEAQKHALERHLADVAHDLKTPIASLQVALELCAAAEAPADRAALLTRGLEDTVYLGELVGNLRLACQLGDGLDPLDGDPRTDLGLIVERVVRRLSFLARRRGVALDAARPDEEAWVRCDPTMMEQAVSNLVHNAITHGSTGGHAVLLLEHEAGERFRLAVVDDGPGLPPGDLLRLGERRFQPSRGRGSGGTGLGASIASELCKKAGFALTFAENQPRGLRVTIEGREAGAPPADTEGRAF